MLLTGTKEESGLNIVISTEHNQLFRQLYAAADAAISNRHLRGMELYAFRSLTPEELIKEAAGSPADLSCSLTATAGLTGRMYWTGLHLSAVKLWSA